MSILFDQEIWAALQGGLFRIDPEITSRQLHRIRPASIDVHMGGLLLKQMITGTRRRIEDSGSFIELIADENGEWVLEPGNFYLGCTNETVALSKYIAMQLDGKSSWGRLGLEVHSTAGWIDPGFIGQITLEMKVIGKDPVVVKVGDPIAQITVHQSRVGSAVPYGDPSRGSKYQGQMGPTPNRRRPNG